MLRTIPVDADRAGLVATGHVEPVMVWADRDGRRVVTEDQERDEATGHPLWTVHVLVVAGDRPETVAVRVPAPHRPEVTPLGGVGFEHLTVNVRVGRDNRVAGYWSAAGLAGQRVKQHADAA